ncbi:chemotaxis protein CheW [Desulfothermus okinawensis JCM 13304]
MQDTKQKHDQMLQLVSFKLGDEEFGVDIMQVQEIIRMQNITSVPNAPDFVEGVINLRGRVIPIIDLRKRFGLEEKSHDKATRIIVVKVEEITVGLVVDEVSEVLRIPIDTVEPPPPIVAGVESEYIKGVGKLEDRLLILLDLTKTLSKEEKASLQMM